MHRALRPAFPFLLTLAALVSLPALAVAASSRADLDDRALRAGSVFRELRDTPDREIPSSLVARSRCVAVIPNVLKAAWVIGARHGKGLLSCRGTSGDWSPPVHVTMTGGSLGFQVGVSSTDVVLFFMTSRSMKSFTKER